MSFKENIKKLLIIGIWCCLGLGVLVLLVAAINRKNSRSCKAYRIEINDGKGQLYVDQKSILNLLTENGTQKLTGKTIASYDLKKMEELLKTNAWIRDAQLFFDNTETLRIKVTERTPIARIFAVSGNSFFIDSSCVQLPLPDHIQTRVPVFTGFPLDKVRIHGTDSALLQQIKTLSGFIMASPFWLADIEQISITAKRTFQMVPVIGNHLIEFGDGNNYMEKFHRLLIFYEEVAARTSFDRYSRLDVRFAGQVIGTRRGSDISRNDSLLAIKNIQQLIRSSQQWQADTVKQQVTKPLEHNTITEQSLTGYDLVADDEDSEYGSDKVKSASEKKEKDRNSKNQSSKPKK